VRVARRCAVAALCLAGSLRAEEEAVLAAFGKGDAAALRAMAEKDEPDPWVVADRLCAAGKQEAALALARASDRPAVAGLAAYVGGWPDRADARRGGRKAATEAGAALAAGDVDRAVALVRDADHASVGAIAIRHACGYERLRAGRYAEAWDLLLGAAEDAERLGWTWLALRAFYNAGLAGAQSGDYERMLRASGRAAELARGATAYEAPFAAAAGNAGCAACQLGRYEEARRWSVESLEAAERLGLAEVAANSRTMLGNICERTGEYGEARRHHLAVLAYAEKAGDPRRAAQCRSNLANVALGTGDYREVVAEAARAAAESERHGDAMNVARALAVAGFAQWNLGEYAEARESMLRARDAASRGTSPVERALVLMGVATLQSELGEPEQAIAILRETQALFEKAGAASEAADNLGNLGVLLGKVGRDDEAEAALLDSLARAKALGRRTTALNALVNLVDIDIRRGRLEQGLSRAREARLFAATPADHSLILINEADTLRRLGRADESLAVAEAALERSLETGSVRLQILARQKVALALLAKGEHASALAQCREAVVLVPLLAGGLGDQEGAEVRSGALWIHRIGLEAALGQRDAREAWWFLESGRAAGLLQSLGAAGRAAATPADLRAAEKAARSAFAEAGARFDHAVATGRRESILAKRKDLDDSRKSLLEVVERVRGGQRGAAALGAKPADLDECRRRLGTGRVLVLYGATGDAALALVLSARGVRLVTLGDLEAIRAACTALACDDPGVDPAAAAARLREMLVDPLGLREDERSLLVSPFAAMSYVPFALLAPGREVACAPSGTTLLALHGPAAGTGVVAVGDPAAPGVAPLPAARTEARGIGDVVLVGEEATCPRLFEEIARRPRWRAVHLACHGTIDGRHPTLSALRLAPAGGDDGQLRCLDLFGRSIPADLVVLSACETARGRVYEGEGILGFTRAFMAAGASRVLVSLWKVDDEATRALMTEFYGQWRKVGAAAALKAAQEHVRAQEKWRHPYYWAAWQLWGLPE
jgi:tetratricopeptide (TPR) repeat protein